MLVAAKPFLTLTADDVMSHEVVMIPQELSFQGAAHLLSQADVSGAPVVDVHGRCVGVLSATDFVHWADEGCPRGTTFPGTSGCVCCEWQTLPTENLPEDAVSRYMTADPVMVAPGTTIVALARMMLDAHIHRIIVVDRERRPIGIVSSIDLLAAMARADARP
jgi:CBS-domain-containing membrane protein